MRLWSALCVNLLLLSACHDRTFESPVPAGYVDFSCNIYTVNTIYQQDSAQATLESPGGYVRCYEKHIASAYLGTGGLLLVQALTDNLFYAYDLACPQCYVTANSQPNKIHRLQVASDGMTAICPDCESKFGAIFWGSPAPTAGPANKNNYLLRQYHATLVGDKLLVRK